MVDRNITKRFTGYWPAIIAFLLLTSLAASVLYARMMVWVVAVAVLTGLYLFYRLVVSVERIADRL
ncbi:hypothetical protein BRD22_01355 [Halobacteriales archaeon SW_8_68_21]|nr:MAG: hypothetical protein BRD22_01355 [Halobacteriales archaeon SW_8_68_21]